MAPLRGLFHWSILVFSCSVARTTWAAIVGGRTRGAAKQFAIHHEAALPEPDADVAVRDAGEGRMEADSGTIVAWDQKRKWWGFPNYMRELEIGLRTWEEFALAHGHFGRTCTPQTVVKDCSEAYVCRAGVCGQCMLSRDCGEQFKCVSSTTIGRRICVPRDLKSHWTWREGMCTVLVVITALLSAAAGMGGGGVYVPLLLLLLGFSTKEAVPLSQAMIVGGATINIIMFCGDRHPKFPQNPKIDYDVIMMLNPGLAAGVTLGVMCNMVSPQWLIVGVLIVTLVIALEKSMTKGISSWRKESEALARQAAAPPPAPGDSSSSSRGSPDGKGGLKFKLADFPGFVELALTNQRQLTLIFGCWTCFLAVNVMKAEPCSFLYWVQLAGLLAICFAFTWAGAQFIVQKQGGADVAPPEGMLAWTPRTLKLYPLLSTVAGFLGGFLGIGGGIIMGPLLLELGMIAEASQATTAMVVFLSSSLATIQFVVLGKAMPEYALWFTTWVIFATLVGQTVIDYALKKWQRSSPIVLSIAAIILGSLVMMSIIGARDVYTDIERGADMGFNVHHLCNLHR